MQTPPTWLAERVAGAGRWSRDNLDRTGITDHIPARVLHWGFLFLIVLFFLDEFLILAAIFGGPIAVAIFAVAGGLYLLEQRTHLISRTWTRSRGALPGVSNGRYKTRRKP